MRVRVGARSRADEMLAPALPLPLPLPQPQPRPAAPTLSLSLKSQLLNSSCAAPDPPAKIRISAKNKLQYLYAHHPSHVVQLGPCHVLPSQGLQYLIEHLKLWLYSALPSIYLE